MTAPEPGIDPVSPPSILLVHERYKDRAGEDAVFDAELALLQARGRDVRTLVIDNDSIPEHPSPRARLRLGLETLWSHRAANRLRNVLIREPADIVHLHNTFPLLSPSMHVAARDAGAAVVQTVHNFRPICPAATLFRDGAPCHDCVGLPVPWPSVAHGCYRGSRLHTAPIAGMLVVQRFGRTWQAVHAIIALTRFAAAELVAGGLPADRIHVKGNFVEPGAEHRQGPGRGFLFAGRLAPEKGVASLVEACRRLSDGIEIRIAGSGPAAELLEPLRGRPGVSILGKIGSADVGVELARTRALIFPSLWYEGMPMVILEAYAAGVPVIAARIGAAAELVVDGETGLLFEPGDAAGLAQAINWAQEHPAEMATLGRNALRAYEERHTPSANYSRMIEIHALALALARARNVPSLPGRSDLRSPST